MAYLAVGNSEAFRLHHVDQHRLQTHRGHYWRLMHHSKIYSSNLSRRRYQVYVVLFLLDNTLPTESSDHFIAQPTSLTSVAETLRTHDSIHWPETISWLIGHCSILDKTVACGINAQANGCERTLWKILRQISRLNRYPRTSRILIIFVVNVQKL